MQGTGNSEFSPDTPITREALAVVLMNWASHCGEEIDVSASASDFSDGAYVADWALNGMAYCIEQGLVQGNEDGKLNPKRSATRAEVSTTVMRMLA